MLDTRVVTLKVAGGAVPTNCLVAAFAAGDVTDLKTALQQQLAVREEFVPCRDHTALYRNQYERRKGLLEALNNIKNL